jgi:hypothetical protein
LTIKHTTGPKEKLENGKDDDGGKKKGKVYFKCGQNRE